MQAVNLNPLLQAELAVMFSHRNNTLQVLHLSRELRGSSFLLGPGFRRGTAKQAVLSRSARDRNQMPLTLLADEDAPVEEALDGRRRRPLGGSEIQVFFLLTTG
jgi:hypothetical protein